MAFNPRQPRNAKGEWTSGGGKAFQEAMTASAFMSGATQTGHYAVTAPVRAGYGRRSVATSAEKAEAKRALETQLHIPNGAAEYEVHRSSGLTHKAAIGTVVQNHRGLIETRFGRSSNASPTFHQTNPGESPNPLQRRFKQNPSAAQQKVGNTRHKQLLAARRAARAQYPAGHPVRLQAERAVRQSRKAMGGNAQAHAEYRKARGGK